MKEKTKGGGGRRGGHCKADKTVRKMNIFMNFWKTQSRWDNISKLERRKLIQNHYKTSYRWKLKYLIAPRDQIQAYKRQTAGQERTVRQLIMDGNCQTTLGAVRSVKTSLSSMNARLQAAAVAFHWSSKKG